MKNKLIALKIIKDNQPLGIHKFDRLFYDQVAFGIHWPTLLNELRDEKLIEESGFFITEKGNQLLENNYEN